jgi:simple sugar transport system permease protein
MKNHKFLAFARKWVLVFVVLLLGIVFSQFSDTFLKPTNLLNIVRQTAIMSILAVGITFVIVAGEMDMSFSSIATISSILMLTFCLKGISTYVSWIIVLVLGFIMGCIDAFIVVKLKVPSMLGTIGTKLLFGGIAAWIGNGATVWTSRFSAAFAVPGRGVLLGFIPVQVVILLVVFVIGLVMMERMVIGRYFYAVGGNAVAADHAGINSNKIKALSYIFAGVLSALAGIVIASQFASSTCSVGDSYLFPAIIAVYLGSIFLKDGVPNMWGTLVACILLQEISNGFSLCNVNYWFEYICQGIVMVAAIATMVAGKKKKV